MKEEQKAGNFLTNSPIRNEKREVFQQICPSVVKLKRGRVKEGLVIISFAFIFLLSMSIISAGDINQDGKISSGEWLKGIWGKITGKAAGQPSPPIISW